MHILPSRDRQSRCPQGPAALRSSTSGRHTCPPRKAVLPRNVSLVPPRCMFLTLPAAIPAPSRCRWIQQRVFWCYCRLEASTPTHVCLPVSLHRRPAALLTPLSYILHACLHAYACMHVLASNCRPFQPSGFFQPSGLPDAERRLRTVPLWILWAR